MSHLRLKTKYAEEAEYGSTKYRVLYADHNLSCDCTTIYNDQGEVMSMSFCEWESGNDLDDALLRLLFPYKDKEGKELKEGVEYCNGNELEAVKQIVAKNNEERIKRDNQTKLRIYEVALANLPEEEKNSELYMEIVRWINIYKPSLVKESI